MEDGRPVADQADLAQLAGEHDDGGAAVGQLAHQVVDLVARVPDVDAAGGVEQQRGAEPRGEPAADGQLLLVPAREAAGLGGRAGVDGQPGDRLPYLPAFPGGVDGSPSRPAGEQGQGDVLRIGRCGSKAMRPVLGTSTTPRLIAS